MTMKTITGALLFLFTVATQAATITADEIVKKVDQIRNPADSFSMNVEVVNKNDASERSLFEVNIRGNNRTLIKTLEPSRDRGRNMLMLDEDMWLYIPNLKRAVRIGLSQKLTGQAANGDISRMRWSGDYSAQIENDDEDQWVLLLSANKKGLTYDKVRAWVSKPDFRPVRAQFLSPSGKPLKLARYGGYKPLAGMTRPSEIEIQDAIRENEVSLIKVLKMETRTFPDSMFNQNNLR